jgi:hypothetical protein
MADFEGSVNMEGFEEADEATEETSSENINKSEDESTPEATPEAEQPEETTTEDKPVLTDKGTKLDPNPQSALHQELANAKREAEEYRQFMSDPKQVKNYLAELEKEAGNATGETRAEVKDRAEEEGLITDPSKIVTPEDFQSYVKFLTNDLNKAKQELIAERDGIRTESREKAISQRIVGEIDALEAKYSFLREKNADGSKNPEYDKELTDEIGNQFDEIDKDPKTGKYQGRISIAQIAERAIRIRKLGEATGSKNAQTTVLDKRNGAIKTGGGASSASDESKMTSTQLIASRMARVAGGSRR